MITTRPGTPGGSTARSLRAACVVAACLSASGCVRTGAGDGLRRVAGLVEERTGRRVAWSSAGPCDLAVDGRIDAILTRGPTPEEAVQIALLRNPSLQAAYEDLGVAQADLVQAGLLANPVFSLAVMPALGRSTGAKVEYSVALDFLDLLRRPVRMRAAWARRDVAVLRTAQAVLDLAHETEVAYLEVQAFREAGEARRTAAEALSAAAELARRQNEAGTATDLDAASQEAASVEAAADLRREKARARVAGERLLRLMGLAGAGARRDWTVPPRIEEVPVLAASVSDLEARALAGRFDLLALRKEVDALRAERPVPGGVRAGVQGEREPEGPHVLGPAVEAEVPILDTGQAERMRLRARLRGALARTAAKAQEVREEVRAAESRFRAASETERAWREDLLPRRSRITGLTQREYNAMQVGAATLLDAKRGEVEAGVRWIEAKRDAWIALADLAHAAGGRLPLVRAPLPAAGPAEPEAAEPAPAEGGHEHGGH